MNNDKYSDLLKEMEAQIDKEINALQELKEKIGNLNNMDDHFKVIDCRHMDIMDILKERGNIE